MTVGQALAADTAAVAVLDGPMFHKCSGQPDSYSTYTCGVPDYMHKDSSRNVNIPSRNVTRGITLSVNAAGQVTMQRGANAAADAAHVAVAYTRLGRERVDTVRSVVTSMRSALIIVVVVGCARKTLLLDLSTLAPKLSPALAHLENFEGLAFGPVVGGMRTLLVMSDDNFRQTQKTSFLLFGMK